MTQIVASQILFDKPEYQITSNSGELGTESFVASTEDMEVTDCTDPTIGLGILSCLSFNLSLSPLSCLCLCLCLCLFFFFFFFTLWCLLLDPSSGVGVGARTEAGDGDGSVEGPEHALENSPWKDVSPSVFPENITV